MVFFEDVFEARRPVRPKSARVAVSSSGNVQRRTAYASRGNVNIGSPVSSSQWVKDTIKTALKEQKRSGHLGAIKLLTHALTQKSFDQGIVLRGWFYLEYGNYTAGREDFITAVQSAGKNSPIVNGEVLSQAYRGLACSCMYMDDFSAAEAAFSKSLLLDRKKYPTLLGMCILNLKFHKTLAVGSIVHDIFAVMPNMPHGNFLSGLAKYRWGIKHDAMKDFENCIYTCFQMSPMPCHLLALSIKYQIEVMIIEERFQEANEKSKILLSVLRKECKGKEMGDFVSIGLRMKCWDFPSEKHCTYYERMTRAMMILSPDEDTNSQAATDKPPGELDKSILYAANVLENAKKVSPANDYRVFHWQGYANILLGQWNQGFSNFRNALSTLQTSTEGDEQKLLHKVLSYGVHVSCAGIAVEKGMLHRAIRYLSVAEKTQQYIHRNRLKKGDASILLPVTVWRRALIKMYLVQISSERKERKVLLKAAQADLKIALDRVHSHPTCIRVRGYLASAYRQNGKPKRALTELDCALYMVDEYFDKILQSFHGISQTPEDEKALNIVEQTQKQKFLPLARTLWIERAASFIALGHFEDAYEDLNAFDNSLLKSNEQQNDDTETSINKKSSPAHALRVRLNLEIGKRSEALKLSTKLLWSSQFSGEDISFRLWVHHQHIICLANNNLFGTAERHCSLVIDELLKQNTVGIEHIIDLRGRLRIHNGSIDLAIKDFIDANRRQQRFMAVANDLLAVRAMFPVTGNGGWTDEKDVHARSAQKLSIAIRTISVKQFVSRNKLHDHRSKPMFGLFYLHMYRGAILICLHQFRDAFLDFEYALNHLEQDPTKVGNASRKPNTIGSVHNHDFSSSYVAFHGIKMYLAVKTFVAYNGGIALMQDGQYQAAAGWFKISMACLEDMLNEKKQILGERDKLESKLYENRYKVAKTLHAIANLAIGNSRQGKKDLRDLGGKKFMKNLEVGNGKAHGNIPILDMVDGCINSAKKKKNMRKHVRREGIPYINNKMTAVRAGAFSIKTRPVIFWPLFSKNSISDSLPSIERFSILSYAINNARNQDDIVTTPCKRIMSLHLSEALEHDGQTPDVIKVASQMDLVDASAEDLQRADIYDNYGSQNVGDEVDFYNFNEKSLNDDGNSNALLMKIRRSSPQQRHQRNLRNKLDTTKTESSPGEDVIGKHIEELRRRKEELTHAILKSEQQRGGTKTSTEIENSTVHEEYRGSADVENKGEIKNAKEGSLLQKRPRQSLKSENARASTSRGSRRNKVAQKSTGEHTSNVVDIHGKDMPTWKSLGFEGEFKDQFEVFAGYPSFSEDDAEEVESQVEEDSLYSSATSFNFDDEV